MATFTPPRVQDRPPFLPDSTEIQKELWQHFESRYRGVNVWILSDGNVVQDTATAENDNTDMSSVYPWDVNNPSAPYVRAIFIDALPAPQVATDHDTAHAIYPTAYFAGGSSHPVTAPQVALLEGYTSHGTGYTDCIT